MRIFILILVVFLAMSVTLSAQSKGNNLKVAIGRYASRVVTLLNRNKDKYRYKVENKNSFHSDVDGDGDFDAVVEIFFCERGSCHPTTNSSRLAVFLNTKGTYKMVADRSFVLYGKINSVDNDKINVDVYGLDDDDPQCCPQLKRFEKYAFKGNKLVKLKR